MAYRAYGDGDATHQALGGVEAIRRLVEAFYDEMDTLPEARRIRDLHPPDFEVSIDKLARFLSGWTGGPKPTRRSTGRSRSRSSTSTCRSVRKSATRGCSAWSAPSTGWTTRTT